MESDSALALLKDRIDLDHIPFTERGSRILVMRRDGGLVIRFSERWQKRDQRLSGYRERPPLIDCFVFTDEEGRPLEYTLESYPHRLDFHTGRGVFSLVFMDMETLLFSLPQAACGLSFCARLNEEKTDRRGGILRVTGDIRRNLAYTTNRRMTRNEVETVEDGYFRLRLAFAEGPVAGFLLNLTPRLGFNRYIPDLETAFAAAARRWEAWFAAVPPVEEVYRRQYYYAWWVMRAGLISTRYFTTREAMTPSKIHYVGIWQWDAYFHALAYRHLDSCLARDQLRVVLDHQRADGMIPDAIHDEGTITHLTFPVEADVTKPPLLAWAAWKLYQADHDREFLEEIYEPIVRWNRWWIEQNDLEGDGLCEYQHPFSSGLDDSPLWERGMPVTAPDLNTYLVLQMENLARIARVLGEETDAARWEQSAQRHLALMIDKLWDEQAGYFWAYYQGEPLRVRTPFNLFPLLCGGLPPAITGRLVQNLTDPQTFWARYPVRTVALGEPSYDPWQMWRGPSWININYLLIEGLQRCGYAELGRDLRRRTLELMMGQPDLYEYYNPENGQPSPKAAPIFGWSAAMFIELAIQAYRENHLPAESKPGA